jgi:hypothetical protein
MVVMENLRVCWLNRKGDYNCCECEKCFRNMIGLYICNSLSSCKTFDKPLSMNKLLSIRVSDYCLKYYIALHRALTSKKDKSDVTKSLAQFIELNQNPTIKEKVYWNTRNYVRELDKRYNKNRLYWYLARKGVIA